MAKMIGVVGGMGTYASIDLLKKIADNTDAGKDQDHLPVTMISLPSEILDRSEFLFGEVDVNPGIAISRVAQSLSKAGASLLALACNTAHVPEIIGIVEKQLPEGMKIVNMIEEVAKYISGSFAGISKIGVLATNGTYRARVYSHYLEKHDLSVLYPSEKTQFELVHPSIYDPGYGIKADSNPVSERSVSDLLTASKELIEKGAEIIVLGCTEIPLALSGSEIFGKPAIDANDVLAKALVREALT